MCTRISSTNPLLHITTAARHSKIIIISSSSSSSSSGGGGGGGRGELSYLAPLGSENISAPYFKQCFFRGGEGYYPPDSQTPRLPVPRQK